jgi:hypothetical protein
MEHASDSPKPGGRIVPTITVPTALPTAPPTAAPLAVPSAVPTAVPLPMPQTRSFPSTGVAEAFTIDCAECAHRHTTVCDDCVVSFIVDRHPDDAIVVDADEARAVRLLEQAGLVPGVRHSRQVG